MKARPSSSPSGERVRVSVVIPCYNYGSFLPGCVESMLSQEGVDIDLTIVDDASTDDSARIAEGLAAADPRVRVVARDQNLGHIATFNEALASATAPYVVKMDPDDLLPPGAIRRAVDLLDAHPEVTFVYGFPKTFGEDAPADVPTAVRSWSVWEGEEWIQRVARRAKNPISQPEVVIRRSALVRTGGHHASVPAASDLHLWLHLASLGSVGRVNGPVQGFYRLHAQSMQHTIHAGYLADLASRRDAFSLFFDARPRTPGLLAAERSARRALALDALSLAVRAADGELDLVRPVGDYLDFAAEQWPGVRGTRRWRFIERHVASGGRPSWLGRVARSVELDIRFRLRWRRWRRTGLWA